MTRTSVMKRFSALMLALMMCLGLFPVSAFADGEESGESAHEHSWSDWTVTRTATCTEAGERQHTCTVCGTTGTESVPVIPHSFGAWEITREATCTEAGEQQHTCTVCSTVETAAVSVIPHSFGAWEITREATCTETGEQQHACTVCGTTETEAIPVIPHCFGVWEITKEATCTETGEQQHACTVCGAIVKEPVPVIPHSYGGWTVTKEATCTETGEQQHTCTVCGANEREPVPVVAHSYGGWTVTIEPTCTKEGKKEHTCTVCGALEKEAVPVLPHSFGAWEVTREATCTEKGRQQRTCAVCGEVEKESIPVIPHSFGDWEITREPTCTKEGKQERTCTVCGEVEKEPISVIPHEFGAWEITREPTCTEKGRQQHTCAVCGEVEKESIPVIPHDFGEWEITREPTCTKEGKKEHACAVCSEVEKEYIPVIEHDWDEDGVCTVCGAEDENKPEETKTFTVLWLNEDGEELERDEAVPEGTVPNFDGAVPVKDEDDDYTYEFSGWNPDPVPVAEDAVYTAQFGKTEKRSDAMEITEIIGAVSVSVSAPEGAFLRGTEIRIAPASADVSSIAENAELVGAAQVSFIKNGEAQTAESPVSIRVSMLAAQNEADTWQVFQESSGVVIPQNYGSGFSVTEAAVFGVARIPAETFTVTFDPANGEEPVSVSVVAGSAIGEENMPTAPEKTDCDFEKWVDAEDGETEITAETVVAADMSVLAVYKRQMPAVSFQKSSGGVYVSVTAEEGTFPAGTEMTVTPLGSGSSLEAMSDRQGEEVVATRVVDITFWFDGEEIQPEKPVAVTLGVAWYADEQSIDVVHYSDGGVSVVASDVAGTSASFAADHFSAYGVIVKKAGPPMGENAPFAKTTDDLIERDADGNPVRDADGNPVPIAFYIAARSKNSAYNDYYLMDIALEHTNPDMVKKTAANDIGSAAKYYFEPVKGKDEYYRIRTEDGMYLQMSKNNNDNSHLKLVNGEGGSTEFKVTFTGTKEDGEVEITATVEGQLRYLNLKKNDAGIGFQGYKNPRDIEKDAFIRLVFSDSITEDDKGQEIYDYNDPYELGGGEFAILYYSGDSTSDQGRVMTNVSSESEAEKLTSWVVTVNNDGVVSLGDGAEAKTITWIFEADHGGHYKLKNKETGAYLRFTTDGGVQLTEKENLATIISVSPGSKDGKTTYGNNVNKGQPTENKFRFSWTCGEKTETIALSSLVGVDEEDNFYGLIKNILAQDQKLDKGQGVVENVTQWFYLVAPPHKITYSYIEPPPGAPAVPAEKTYNYRDTVPAAAIPTLEGYTFSGWIGEVTTMPSKDVKVTGTWSINSHTVTYKYEGDVPAGAPKVPEAKTYTYGADVPKAKVQTLTGYTFSGWTGEVTTMPDEDVTVTGTWKANSYTVKFDKNAANATGTMAEQSFQYDVQKALTANAFKRNGYTFKGWGESASATTVKYADKASVKNLTTKNGETVTLYAIWEAETEVIVTISAVQDTVLYDGAPHRVIGFLAQSNNAEYNNNIDNNYRFIGNVEITRTNAGTDTLDLQTLTFQNTNTNFPNVTFRVNPNNRYNSLTVNPRTVIMTSASAEKDYDGEPLTSETVTVTGDGFVGGQGAAYTFTGTQTEEGSSQNSFTYTLTGGALAGNYNITSNFGTLTVHAVPVNEDIEDEKPPLVSPEEIEEDDTPLAAPGGWALVNMIAMILTACTAGGMIATYRNRAGEDDDLVRENSGENEHRKSKFLGLIPGLGSIATFFLTEDLNSKMVMTDRWTVLMLSILVIGAALAWLTRNDKPEEDLE